MTGKCVALPLPYRSDVRETVKYFSPTTHLCIIRVARDQHTLAWGAVTLLTSINGTRIIPNVVHVSGPSYLYRQ